jgi:DNA-binding GntR family transcriptional regulator
MLAGGIESWSASERFRVGAEFHETIVAGSGNRFFLDALKNVNRLRRLIEYRQQTKSARDHERLHRQCEEHLRLLDLIEAGRRVQAAEMLREHLDVVGEIKTGRDAARNGRGASARGAGRGANARDSGAIEVHL